MLLIGNLTNRLITPSQHERCSVSLDGCRSQSYRGARVFWRSRSARDLSEEFVFRGYVQRQCEALFGNLWLASIVQIALFTQGHLYQGVTRLLPVLLIGTLLTAVALWRKSLIPGIIAHGWGDSLVALTFFLK